VHLKRYKFFEENNHKFFSERILKIFCYPTILVKFDAAQKKKDKNKTDYMKIDEKSCIKPTLIIGDKKYVGKRIF